MEDYTINKEKQSFDKELKIYFSPLPADSNCHKLHLTKQLQDKSASTFFLHIFVLF